MTAAHHYTFVSCQRRRFRSKRRHQLSHDARLRLQRLCNSSTAVLTLCVLLLAGGAPFQPYTKRRRSGVVQHQSSHLSGGLHQNGEASQQNPEWRLQHTAKLLCSSSEAVLGLLHKSSEVVKGCAWTG